MARAKARTRPRGASARRPAGSQAPAWALLVTGLLVGFFLGMLVPLSSVPPSPAADGVAHQEPEPEPAAQQASRNRSTRFDFYTLLPEREVIVSSSEPSVATETDAPSAATPVPRTRFLLQAGSFRRVEDADRRRAQVLLLGLDARIEDVHTNGGRWHRVIVGPFDARGPLDRARATLISENIDTLVLSQKRG